MAFFTETELRARADRGKPALESITESLTKKAAVLASTTAFDIFLSHSFSDQKLILGMWLALEDMGYKVYVDWIQDKGLSRDSVTKETAQILRGRMLTSKSLFYAASPNSTGSKWMPWELGFMDGHNRKSAILPITQSQTDTFNGQEYLAVYPYVNAQNDTAGKKRLWIHNSRTSYVAFEDWLRGKEPRERA